jgi:hypothetical protein
MEATKYEYRSEFARRYFRRGKAEGKAEGRAEIVRRLLTYRFGALSEAQLDRVRNADDEQLNVLAERLLQAATLQEALGSLWGDSAQAAAPE